MTTNKKGNKVITRRKFCSVIGVTALGSGVVLPSVSRAQAQSSLDRIKASGKLRIGAVADGAPYYLKNLVDGVWRGFNIDICKALAEDLGVELEINETTWGNSVLDLQSDKIDVFFGLNPTPQRMKVIDFSGPVFNNSFTVIAKKGTTRKTWDDFNAPDVRISVDAGSSHDAVVTRLTPKAQISRLKTASDATAALQSGRADAQCLVLIIALTVLAKNPAIGELIVPAPTEFTTSHAGFRREEDKSWAEFVDAWISKRRASGFVHDAIVKNMELVGVSEKDFPEDTKL